MPRARPLAAALPAAALLLAAPLAGVARSGDEPALPPAVRMLVSGNHAFACDLFRLVAGRGGNLFVSPHSISSALAMTRAGAGGETARQMDAVLHLPPGAPAAYRALVAALTTVRVLPQYGDDRKMHDDPVYDLSIANGLFTQRGWPIRDAFRATVGDDFSAEFRELDFAKGEEARGVINAWVDGKTKHRIQDIVPPGLPSPDTRMVLANAIHFKAQWDKPFWEDSTKEAPFTVAPGKVVEAPRMHREDRLAYGETPTVQVVEIPYRGGDTSMVVVLPKARDGLDALVSSLDATTLSAWTGPLEQRTVALELPRFSFASDVDLSSILPALGMKDAFDAGKADFGGISLQKPLFIGAALHKAFVAVDEKGTEAAAATVVMMSLGAPPRPDAPVPFVVDHPFLFLIRHTQTGELLFLGRVVDPTAK